MYKKLFFITSFLSVVTAHADTTLDELNAQLQRQQQQIAEQFVLLENMRPENQAKIQSLISGACLPAPLPTAPRTPNYSVSFTDYFGTAKLVFWREPCHDGSGTALLVQVTPTTNAPFFCSSQLSIIQNGTQFNNILLQSGSGNIDTWCNRVYTKSTALVNPTITGQFNPLQAMTIIYAPTGGSTVNLAIPVSSGIAPSITGSLSGYKNYTHSCKNTRTGTIKSYTSQTATTWNCSGLSIRSGDTIQTTISGPAN